ncbi:hypothetical protein LCGC14_2456650 [marine sediment metagenome]|uniref:PD-(D/E)XK endonuclease-like domain-containing protein n=1 Tax=marine sediment metagenome TaxID=412755 RepID=A0A0F9C255_9ZZZZ
MTETRRPTKEVRDEKGGQNPRVRSPSRTEDFLYCPILYQLKHIDKWVPNLYGKREISFAMGHAIGAGLDLFYRHTRLKESLPLIEGEVRPIEDYCVRVAMDAFEKSIQGCLDQGRTLNPKDEEVADQALGRVIRAMPRVLEQDPIPSDWTILGSEVPLPDHGYCRIDLPVRDPVNLAVLDIKTSLTLAKDKVHFRRREYTHNWQQMHYCWAYGDAMGEPVYRYHILQVVLEPKTLVYFWPYSIHPENMAAWLVSARQTWKDIDDFHEGRRDPVQKPVHYGKYGDCEMFDACLTHHYDEGLMRGDYIQIGGKT